MSSANNPTESGRSNPTADAAVVIVNWNTRGYLEACLRSLGEGSQQRLSRVVVVDNASTDGSAGMVESRFPWVQLIQPGSNTGYAAGNNLGLRAVEEPYVLLLNPDTELERGAVDILALFLDSHPCSGIVAPQLRNPDGSIQRSCRGFPTPAALIPELLGLSRLGQWIPPFGAYRMTGWNHDTERQVDQPMGSALMLRRAAFEKIGLMDEQFPLFFNEVDWLYRISQQGWQIWFTPEAHVLHHLGASTRQVRVRAAWMSHTGLHAFYHKHYRRRLRPFIYGLVLAAIYLHAILVVGVRAVQGWVRSPSASERHQGHGRSG